MRLFSKTWSSRAHHAGGLAHHAGGLAHHAGGLAHHAGGLAGFHKFQIVLRQSLLGDFDVVFRVEVSA